MPSTTTILAKRFGTPPLFHLVFVWNWQLTCNTTHKHGLNKIFPPNPLNKVEVHKVYKICKRCLTCNTQHCSGGEGGQLELHFPHLKRKVSLTFWPGLSALQSYLLTKRIVKIGIFSWIPDGIRAKRSRNIENHSNLGDICSCLVKMVIAPFI